MDKSRKIKKNKKFKMKYRQEIKVLKEWGKGGLLMGMVEIILFF